jgi:hypothetical protein
MIRFSGGDIFIYCSYEMLRELFKGLQCSMRLFCTFGPFRNDTTCCMYPDFQVSLLLGAADNVFKQEGETAYLASKRNIKQRLVAFYMYHPEVRKPFCASHLVTASSEVRSCFSNQITTVNNNVVYVFNHPKLRKLFCASHLITEFYSTTGLYQAKNIVQKMLVARVF